MVAKNALKNFLFSDLSSGQFDDLIQSVFGVIHKITFANFCKPTHNIIIVPVSSDPLNLEKSQEWKSKSQEWKELL